MAIFIGGPAALLDVDYCILGMTTKYVQVSLLQIQDLIRRRIYCGGPMCYMQNSLKSKWLGVSLRFVC